MKTKTIGFIVPIYNIRIEWVELCLDSLVSAYDRIDGDMEAIIVDNGSTDKKIYPAIKKKYEKYKWMKIVRLEKNNGKPQATWYGLKNIKSKYIQVLDPDDWVRLDDFRDTVKILRKNPADFYLLNYTYYNNKTGKYKTKRVMQYSKLISHRTFSRKNIRNRIPRATWHFDTNAILNRKFMLDKKFKFPKDVTAYEDVYINMWNLSKAKKIIHINKSIYNYRVKLEGENLSSNKKFVSKLPIYRKMIDALIELDYNNPLTKHHMVYHFALQLVAWTFWTASDQKKRKGREIIKDQIEPIKKNNIELYRMINSSRFEFFNWFKLYNAVILGGRNTWIRPIGDFVMWIRD